MCKKYTFTVRNTTSYKIIPPFEALGKLNFPLGTIELWLEDDCEMLSFQYTKDWLDFEDRYPITPRLPLRTAAYIKPASHIDFSIFRDYEENSCWQSLLKAKYRDTPEKNFNLLHSIRIRDKLSEYNYFPNKRRGTFSLGDLFIEETGAPVPAKTILHFNFSLNDSRKVVESLKSIDINKNNTNERTIVNMCALGGQRVKHTFIDKDGNIWIAKLPLTEDGYCAIREFLAFEIAKEFEIKTALCQLKKEHNKDTSAAIMVLLTKRFDREVIPGSIKPTSCPNRSNSIFNELLPHSDGSNVDCSYTELAFATATSLLGNRYEDRINPRNIYLELAEFMYLEGDTADLEELWRRMLFCICINNRDDNLYNHGFLRKDGKWRLSPMFGVKFSTDCYLSDSPISLNAEELELKLDSAIELSMYFGVSIDATKTHIKELIKVISEHKKHLIKLKAMPEEEIEILKVYADKLPTSQAETPDAKVKDDPKRGDDGKFKKKD